MSVESAVLAGQQAAQARMTDRCTIRHPGGTYGTRDDETGETPFTPHEPFYDGPCEARDDAGAMRDALVAEQQVGIGVCLVKLPRDVTEVRRGDILELVDSRDPSLTERGEMTVQTVHAATYSTTRRLLCTWR